MTKILRPLFLFLLLLLLHFFFISNAAEPAQNYTNCPSYYCGDVLISYPFWREDNTTTSQFCGYHGFAINCADGNRPTITLPGDSYYVEHISYEYHSLTLVDIDVTKAGNCPRVSKNVDIVGLPMNFSRLNVNLSFHFNCTEVPRFGTPIPCLGPGDNQSYVNIAGTEPEGFDWDRYGCDDEVVTRVLETAVNNRNRLAEEFRGALTGGFALNWHNLSSCGSCEESGGRCGYKNPTWGQWDWEVICFCSDGRNTTVNCKNGGW